MRSPPRVWRRTRRAASPCRRPRSAASPCRATRGSHRDWPTTTASRPPRRRCPKSQCPRTRPDRERARGDRIRHGGVHRHRHPVRACRADADTGVADHHQLTAPVGRAPPGTGGCRWPGSTMGSWRSHHPTDDGSSPPTTGSRAPGCTGPPTCTGCGSGISVSRTGTARPGRRWRSDWPSPTRCHRAGPARPGAVATRWRGRSAVRRTSIPGPGCRRWQRPSGRPTPTRRRRFWVPTATGWSTTVAIRWRPTGPPPMPSARWSPSP